MAKILNLLQRNDAKYFLIIQTFSKRTPENCLRLLTPEITEHKEKREFETVLSLVCAEFEYSLNVIAARIRSFETFTYVFALLAFLQAILEVADYMHTWLEVKAVSDSALYSMLDHVLHNFAGVLGIALVGFIISRHFHRRIETRRSYWGHFISQIREVDLR